MESTTTPWHSPEDCGASAARTLCGHGLVDERAGGVNLSCHRMVSFLKPYGNAEALKVAKDLQK
jgi:membrane-bound lytic murein transglycosylase B